MDAALLDASRDTLSLGPGPSVATRLIPPRLLEMALLAAPSRFTPPHGQAVASPRTRPAGDSVHREGLKKATRP